MHVIGAGLAGLSAAVALTQAGHRVTLLEAGPAAGGRCRSYFDRELGLRIDNGNHLLLSGNKATFAYLDTIGARQTLHVAPEPAFPFIDLRDGRRWVLRPSPGRIPWWVLARERRVPGTKLGDYLRLLRLRRITSDATVAATVGQDPLYRGLIEPLAVAVLNTPPDIALSRLLSSVMRETLFLGGQACRPALPREGLSESLVDPAVVWLTAHGSQLLTGRRVNGLRAENGRATELLTTDGPLSVEGVVLAAPPWVAADLLPGQSCPNAFQAILNVHFRTEAGSDAPAFIGVVGGTAEWVFVKRGHVSVTISAANRMVDQSADAIASAVWPDVQAALRLDGAMPAWRVVKERRATIEATAAQEKLRPASRTAYGNVTLAGDWTDTGLPGTIEGAIRSGRNAAEALLAA